MAGKTLTDVCLAAIDKACRIIEAGDERLLARDGPIDGIPPDLSMGEWQELYTTLDTARKRARGQR